MSGRDVQMGGRTITLRFSLRAFKTLQDHYGVESIDAVAKRLQDMSKFGVDDLALVFYAATRSKHENLTKEQIFDLIDSEFDLMNPEDSKRLSAILGGTVEDGLPKPGTEENPPPAGSESPSP